VWVFLQDQAGNPVVGGVTVTDGNGNYAFNNLTAGTYRIKFANPGGYYPTGQNIGGDDTVDSDMDLLGFTAFFTLHANDMTIDAGFVPKNVGQFQGNDPGLNAIGNNANSVNGQNIANVPTTVVLFPNPTSDYVDVRFSTQATSSVKIEVFNTLGQRVLVTNFDDSFSTQTRLDLTDLKTGQYLVRITFDGTEVITKPLMVNKF